MLTARMELGLRADRCWPLTWPSSQRWPLNPSWHLQLKLSTVNAWHTPPLRQDDGPQGEGLHRCWPVWSVSITWPEGHLRNSTRVGQDWAQTCSREERVDWLYYLHWCFLHRSTQRSGLAHGPLMQASLEHPEETPRWSRTSTVSILRPLRGRTWPFKRTSLKQPGTRGESGISPEPDLRSVRN